MKLSATTLAILATATAASIEQLQHQQHPNGGNTQLVARDEVDQALGSSLAKTKFQKKDGEPDLAALVAHINGYKAKRDAIDMEIMKRDYAIVTDVLTAINQTQLAPKILDYFVSSPTFEPIVVNVLISVMKSGLISLQAVLDALVSSNLAVNVINDLISDCDLYVDLFNAAEEIISDLASKVKELISEGVSTLISRDENDNSLAAFVVTEKRLDFDIDSVVDNLLDSLYQSGLASSVVKDVLTNSAYLSFAEDLLKAMLANNLIDIPSIISALKESGLITQLFQELLNFGTLSTVAETAFAAFAGQCSGSSAGGTSTPSTSGSGSSGSSGTSGSSGSISSSSAGSGSGSTSNNDAVGPCKKRRRVRRRRSNY